MGNGSKLSFLQAVVGFGDFDDLAGGGLQSALLPGVGLDIRGVEALRVGVDDQPDGAAPESHLRRFFQEAVFLQQIGHLALRPWIVVQEAGAGQGQRLFYGRAHGWSSLAFLRPDGSIFSCSDRQEKVKDAQLLIFRRDQRRGIQVHAPESRREQPFTARRVRRGSAANRGKTRAGAG